MSIAANTDSALKKKLHWFVSGLIEPATICAARMRVFSIVALVFCFLGALALPQTGQAAEADDLRKNLSQARQTIERLQSDLKSAEAKLRGLLNQREAAKSEISKLKSSVATARWKSQQQDGRLAEFAKFEQARQRAAKNVHEEELRRANFAIQVTKSDNVDLHKLLSAAGQSIETLEEEVGKLAENSAKRADNLVRLNEARSMSAELQKSAAQSKKQFEASEAKLQSAVARLELVVADNDKLTSDTEKLTEEMSSARQEVEQQKTKLAKLAGVEASQKHATQELAEMQTAKMVQDEKLLKTQNAVQVSESEVKRLGVALQGVNEKLVALQVEFTATAVSAVAADKVRDMLEQSESKVESLTKATGASKAQVEAANGKIDILASQLETVMKERETARSQVVDLETALEDERRLIAESTEAEKSEQSKRNEAIQITLQAAEAKITTLGKLKDDYLSEISAVKTKLGAATSARDTIAAEKVKVLTEIADLKADLNASRSKTKSQVIALAKLTETKTAYEQANKELADLRLVNKQQVDKLLETREAAKVASLEAKQLHDDLRAANEEVQSTQARISELNVAAKDAAETREYLKQAQVRIASLGQSAEDSKAQAKDANGKLQAEMIKLEDAKSQADEAGAENEILKAALAQTTQQTEQQKVKLAALAVNVAGHEKAVQELDEVRTQNKQNLDELLKSKTATEALIAESKSLRDDADQTKQKLAALETTLEQTEVVAAKADGLAVDLKQASAQVAELTKAANDLKTAMAGVEKEMQDAVLKIQTLETEKVSAISKMDKLKASLTAASSTADEKQAELSKLTKSSEQARDAAAQQFAKARKTEQEMQTSLTIAQGEIAKMNVKLQETNDKFVVAEKESAALSENLASRKQQLHKLKSSLATALGEIREARDDISKRIEKMIEVAVAPPIGEVKGLREQLAAAQKEIARLNTALHENASKQRARTEATAEGL